MARKPFSLKQVLEYRRQMENQKQRELGQRQQLRDEAARALQALQQHQQESERQAAIGGQGRHVLDPAEREATLAYLGAVEQQIDEQRSLVETLDEEVLASREQLVEVLKEKQMLERLQERREAEAITEENRQESRAADEHNTNRVARRLQGLS